MQSRQASAGVRKRFGFTLIELLVVVAIIAVLIAILLPSLSKAKDQTKLTHCASGVRQWGLALNYYMNDYSQWVPQEGDVSSAAGVMRNDAWYNALPIYTQAPRYCYIYPGVSARLGATFTDPTQSYTYTVSSSVDANSGGFKNAWIWYCQAKLDKQKNSNSGLNSFHYTMNAVLDGSGSWGSDAGRTHLRVSSVNEPSSTVFLFEPTGNNPNDSPSGGAGPGNATSIDTARHNNLGCNFLMMDGHCETVKMKNIPNAQTVGSVYMSDKPRLVWGPFQSTVVP
jgi:prepilin-type N-terminal cleavage/methylation domain-containing protein/prepilin-type processing-associated H-X9-DG protein